MEGECTVVSQGILVKYGNEILKLLEVVQKPKEVAVIHCEVHQSGSSDTVRGNRKADKAAKQAALVSTINLLLPTRKTSIMTPENTKKEIKLAELLKC